METKVKKEWTFDQPTEEGFYWIEEEIDKLEIVKVRKGLFKKELVVIFPESGNYTELSYVKGTKWYGPIDPPSTGTIKGKVNEKSDS